MCQETSHKVWAAGAVSIMARGIKSFKKNQRFRVHSQLCRGSDMVQIVLQNMCLRCQRACGCGICCLHSHRTVLTMNCGQLAASFTKEVGLVMVFAFLLSCLSPEWDLARLPIFSILCFFFSVIFQSLRSICGACTKPPRTSKMVLQHKSHFIILIVLLQSSG